MDLITDHGHQAILGKDVVRHPHGQEGVAAQGGPACLALARDSLALDIVAYGHQTGFNL